MSTINVCLNCANRTAECHGTCKKYRLIYSVRNAQLKARKSKETDYYGTVSDVIIRRTKRRHG